MESTDFPTYPFDWGVSFYYEEHGQLVDHLTSQGCKENHVSLGLDSSRTQCQWKAGKMQSLMRAYDGRCTKGVTGGPVASPSSFTNQLRDCQMPGLELGARIRAGACLPAYVEKWKRGYRNT